MGGPGPASRRTQTGLRLECIGAAQMLRRVNGLYEACVRPLLFRADSERIHDWTLGALGWVAREGGVCAALAGVLGADALPVRCMGLEFPNPLGLAAGMDKGGVAVPAWAALGFGFSELGGVTLMAQPGNPRPRMFRVPEDGALINRMGFNNPGAAVLASRMEAWRRSGRWPAHPVGVNLGKSKATPLSGAARDYAGSFRLLRRWADFLVVNVSSPNTPNLRQLQDKAALDDILAALQEENRAPGAPARPILVKVAPDLSFDALDDVLSLAGPREVSGIVATNTTTARPAPTGDAGRRLYREAGGLSGRPLKDRSTEVIRHLYRQSRGAVPIIGVGGIFDAADAWEKVCAGATLVQAYSGLVYGGPGFARGIVDGLRERLQGARWDDAVGSKA